MTRALNPINKHSERVTDELRVQSEKLKWGGIEFPTKVSHIEKFEKNNNIYILVLGYGKEHE